MFLRFTITQIDEDSHKPQGIFSAAYSLLESGDFDAAEWKRLRELLDWFDENLPSPPDSFYASRAIFWFKSDAHKNISRIWEMIYILRAHGYHVEVYKCRRLANISYEDKMQVAAYPWDRDAKITVQ
ncbi:MAG TPA: hypothetical protein VEF04_13610 [Blastocatellia bacterium]|nr:hypothetical protein [Blastocatellia bacterium]